MRNKVTALIVAAAFASLLNLTACSAADKVLKAIAEKPTANSTSEIGQASPKPIQGPSPTDTPTEKPVATNDNEPMPTGEEPATIENTDVETGSHVVANEPLRGVWVASVGNIDFPSKPGLDSKTLKQEIDAITKLAAEIGLNAVFVQVRPTADALYRSRIFPWSFYLTGSQGIAPADGFDPLAYWIESAHKRGLQFHAWINPYRITQGTADAPKHDVGKLAASHPARLHPEWTVAYADGKLYFNPGLPETRALIIDGVMEIVKNYDVDGIHFDDYFYPYPVYKKVNGKSVKVDFDDLDTFKKYGSGFENIDDWRRDNVSKLVKGVYEAIKKEKPRVLFGISPFAVWANRSTNPNGSDTNAGVESYYDLYADTVKWANENWIDYICPQVYWPFDYPPAAFQTVCDWWDEQLKGSNTKLYVGHAAYKVDSSSKAGWEQPDQIERQIKYAEKLESYGGSVFYGLAAIKANKLNVADSLAKVFAKRQRDIVVGVPLNGSKLTDSATFVVGASDPSLDLYLNGKKIDNRTESGFFTAFVQLKLGDNILKFTQGGKTLEVKVTRVKPGTSTPSTQTEKKVTNLYGEIVNDDVIIYKSAGGSITADYFPAAKGMRDNIVAQKGDYYKFAFGGWVYKSNIKTAKGTIKSAKITSISRKSSGGYTAVLMKGAGKAPYTAKLLDDRFVLTLYNINTAALPKAASFDGDPVISKMAVEAAGSSSVKLTFYLKKQKTFYGFDIDYTSDGVQLSIKQPKAAAGGDKPLAGITVAIDPGHGGSAFGAFGPLASKGMMEKDINLAVSLKLKKQLERLGSKVVLTRSDDRFLELSDRVNIIKNSRPDISISLHCNSMPYSAEPSKHFGMFGFYTYDFAKSASDMIIAKAGAAFGIEARGSRADVFALTRQIGYPSVLIEMIFMTNPKEYEKLIDSRNQDNMAKGIAEGIVDFFKNQKQ